MNNVKEKQIAQKIIEDSCTFLEEIASLPENCNCPKTEKHLISKIVHILSMCDNNVKHHDYLRDNLPDRYKSMLKEYLDKKPIK